MFSSTKILDALKDYVYIAAWVGSLPVLYGLLYWLKQAIAFIRNRLCSNAIISTFDEPDEVFYGRENDLSRLKDPLLKTNAIVLLTGPGGVGKTELVKQFAKRNVGNFPGGCFQVNMHDVCSWEDVFINLVRRCSVEGCSAYEYIDVRQESDNEQVDIPQHIRVRNALIRTSCKKGHILIWLDDVQDPNLILSDSALREAWQAGYSTKMQISIVATSRYSFPKQDESVEEIRIGDLTEDACLKIFKGEFGSSWNDSDATAAKQIVRALGNRAFLVRRLLSIIRKQSLRYGSAYLTKVYEWLKSDFGNVVVELADNARMPDQMWRFLKSRLLRENGGRSAFLLAIAISMFPVGRVRIDVLRWLWAKLISPEMLQLERNSEGLEASLSLLQKYGIVRYTGGAIIMHSLDRLIIFSDADQNEDAYLMGVIQEMGRYEGWEWYCWQYLIDHKGVLSRLDIKSFPIEIIVRLLIHSDAVAEYVDWRDLRGADWARLLRMKPKYSINCCWPKLKNENWVSLLINQPQFAKFCDMHVFTRNEWIQILKVQPSLCKNDIVARLFTIEDWVEVVSAQSSLLQNIPKTLTEERNRACLLRIMPQIANGMVLNDFNGTQWVNLILGGCDSRVLKQCKWDRLSANNWVDLLSECPEYADKCDWNRINQKKYIKLLMRQPDLYGRKKSVDLSKKAKVKLTLVYRKFLGLCSFNCLSGSDWSRLLKVYPELEHFCRWELLSGSDWARLLGDRPRFYYRCEWSKLDAKDWRRLCKRQPQFVKRRNSYMKTIKN